MKYITRTLIVILMGSGYFSPGAQSKEHEPPIIVPYKDLVSLIDPADKAVLMDREAFEKLLEAAETHAQQADTYETGQVKQADYAGTIRGDTLTLTGKLTVVSLSERPVVVPRRLAENDHTAIARWPRCRVWASEHLPAVHASSRTP